MKDGENLRECTDWLSTVGRAMARCKLCRAKLRPHLTHLRNSDNGKEVLDLLRSANGLVLTAHMGRRGARNWYGRWSSVTWRWQLNMRLQMTAATRVRVRSTSQEEHCRALMASLVTEGNSCLRALAPHFKQALPGVKCGPPCFHLGQPAEVL